MRKANPVDAGFETDGESSVAEGAAGRTIRAGDSVPDFEARTLAGQPVRYRDIWQNKFLVLVTFAAPESDAARSYRRQLVEGYSELTAHDTVLLVAAEPAPPFPSPGLVLADRWGEVRFVAHPNDDAGLPSIAEIVEWLRFVQMECPECQGETR